MITREEFCHLLQLPPNAATGQILAARTARLTEIEESIRAGGLSKPEQQKLKRLRADLEDAGELVAQLEVIDRVEVKLAEIDAEFAKREPVKSVLQFCFDDLAPRIEAVADEEMRHAFSKRLLVLKDRAEGLVRRAGPEQDKEADDTPRPVGEEGARKNTTEEKVERAVELVIIGPVDRAGGEAKRSPDRLPLQAEAGLVLQFMPLHDGSRRQAPIHFVHRSYFTLGRHDGRVDFTTSFLPKTEENDRKTETISRVNTTFAVTEGQIAVHHGRPNETGEVPTERCGTAIDGRPLTSRMFVNLSKERQLSLGSAGYKLGVMHLPPPAQSRGETGESGRALGGCVRFRPITCREMPVQAVWLLSEASLGSGAQSAVFLDNVRLPLVAVRIHFRNGSFWLEVPISGVSNALLDGRRLAWGDSRELNERHELHMEGLRYKVKVAQVAHE